MSTFNDIQRLDKLAIEIRTSSSNATMMALQGELRLRQSVEEQALCRHAMSQARAIVGSKRWEGWMREHCPEVMVR